MFGIDGGTFATVEHNHHRTRRAAVSPFFSTANVRRLQPVIEERVQACLERLRGLAKTGEEFRIVVVASAFSTGRRIPNIEFSRLMKLDVIMMYCFGKSHNRLEAPDFDVIGYESGHQAVYLGFLMKHMIWILWTIKSLPDFVVKRLGIALAAFVELNAVIPS